MRKHNQFVAQLCKMESGKWEYEEFRYSKFELRVALMHQNAFGHLFSISFERSFNSTGKEGEEEKRKR